MKLKFICLVIALLLLVNTSACTRLKGYFPDKEKDYQLISEIPALTIPADLSDEAIKKDNSVESAIPVFQNFEKQVLEGPTSQSTTSDTTDTNETKESVYVDLVEFSGGATRIRIEDSIERNWRIVGKALSRHSIEIIARDELEKVYSVQYDADFKKIEDGSLWDEALFIFGADPAQEKEFKVRLVENGSLTEIIVLDKNDKPLSKGPGLKLLKLLYQTIKEDLANTN